MNKRPPSGKTKKSDQLLNKEQQYKELNAALEQKSATLISEAESVLRGQDDLFSNLGLSFNRYALLLLSLEDNLRMNCSPVRLSNVCGPGLHRKLWGGFLQVKRRSLSLPGLLRIIIVTV